MKRFSFLAILILLFSFSFGIALDISSAQSPAPPPRQYPPQIEPYPIKVHDTKEPDIKMALPSLLEQNDMPDADAYTNIAFQAYWNGNWEIFAGGLIEYKHPWQQLTYDNASDHSPRLRRGGDWITFVSNRTGNYEIFSMDFNGGKLKQLTNNPASDFYPTWSPDGKKIAFVSERNQNREIYLMNADGANPIRLTSDLRPDFSPTFSPDGKWIAWVAAIDDYAGVIAVMKPDGSFRQVISEPLFYVSDLVWSPSGDEIAFTYDGNGDGGLDIGLLNLKTKEVQLFLTGGYFVDFMMGSFTPKGGLLLTRAEYIYYEGEYYIDKLTMICEGDAPKCPSFGTSEYYYYAYPDAQKNEITVPTSAVKPLPAYTRADIFKVEWSGMDPGPAGIYLYEIQHRIGTSGTWSIWHQSWPNSAPAGEYQGSAGEQIYFRSRAVDLAENREPWPTGDGDTLTTLFKWKVSGLATDNRGVPMAQLSLPYSPSILNQPETDLVGQYQAYFAADGDYEAQIGHSGYGALLRSKLNVSEDQRFDFILPPLDNVIQNGGFETSMPFEGWVSSGAMPENTGPGHSGEQSAALGTACQQPCLNNLERPFPDTRFFSLGMGADQSGTAHIIGMDYNGRVVHSTRDISGNWSPITAIAENISSQLVYFQHNTIAIDPDGNIHAIIVGGDGLYYFYKPAGGGWFPYEKIGKGISPKLNIDPQGNLHLIYRCLEDCRLDQEGIYYSRKNPSGPWQSAIRLDETTTDPLVAVDRNNRIHVVYYLGTMDERSAYRMILPDGTLTPLEYITGLEHGSIPVDIALAGNTLHLVALRIDSDPTFRLLYTNLNLKTQQWLHGVVVGSQLYSTARIEIDPNGGIHLIAHHSNPSVPYFDYFYRSSQDQEYTVAKVPFNPGSQELIEFNIDRRGIMRLAWSDLFTLNFATTPIAEHTQDGSLEYTLTIPQNLHKPYLSFMAFPSRSFTGLSSYAEMRISDGSQSQTVPLTGLGSYWKGHFVDMAPWQGKTVTISFHLHQVEKEPQAFLLVDEVSLGSWLTPRILGVERLERALTIHGENFIQPPTARLNDTPLENVQWIDENRLTATIPDALKIGLFDLWVTNPGGQESVLPDAVSLGHYLMLPLINR